MREIVLDTETTGLDPLTGDRVVEIGCIELINHIPSGQHFHRYINPERPMPEAAFQVHGLSDAFLADKPRFAEIVDEFLEFIGDAPLVIHNAEFDMRFINAELSRLSLQPLPLTRAVDTLKLARQRFPGAQASLDALCRRFGIDNSKRDKHGALLDADLLAAVYLELIGGRQPDLVLGIETTTTVVQVQRVARPARPHSASPEELAAHRAFLDKFVKDSLWDRLEPVEEIPRMTAAG